MGGGGGGGGLLKKGVGGGGVLTLTLRVSNNYLPRTLGGPFFRDNNNAAYL